MNIRRLAGCAGLLSVTWVSPATAVEPWFGRWVGDPKYCTQEGDTADTMPLILRERTIEWFVARCSYRRAVKRGNRWHIRARCSAEGKTSPTAIVLQLRDGRLLATWDKSPIPARQRCPQ